MTTINGWWFQNEEVLTHRDGRHVRAGRTHKVKGRITLRDRGLHASSTIIKAMTFARTSKLWRVELSGTVKRDHSLICASERTYLWSINIEDILRQCTQKSALDVIHLWDAPKEIVRFLRTGDKSLRTKARKAYYGEHCVSLSPVVNAARSATFYAIYPTIKGNAFYAAGNAFNAAIAAAYNGGDAYIPDQNHRLTGLVVAAKRA